MQSLGGAITSVLPAAIKIQFQEGEPFREEEEEEEEERGTQEEALLLLRSRDLPQRKVSSGSGDDGMADSL
ncbi:hypothetical protein EYF80_054733 [Liparis tanakae]|uniref:Uncharacterized protein n=1 Tax=Liparis tanakae TaxID=230148 RepID=A0A4Z2F1S9_9TELE|nr:hypothetical protein EYF80_054733 [Liparis tanakae]